MTPVLYHGPLSCSLAVRLLLAETDVEHELVVLALDAGATRKATYLSVNPHGKVPALTTQGGTITENLAILCFLADHSPEAGLLPAEGLQRAEAMTWLSYLCSTVHPAFGRLLRPERFTSDPAGIDGVRECALKDVTAVFDRIDDHLSRGVWLLQAFSVCDIYLLVFALWRRSANLTGLLPAYLDVDRWLGQMMARPSIAQCVADDMRLFGAQRQASAS